MLLRSGTPMIRNVLNRHQMWRTLMISGGVRKIETQLEASISASSFLFDVPSRTIKTGRKGYTYHYQKSLPRLPIPSLRASLYKYVRAVRPLLSTEDYTKTRDLVAKFGGFDPEKPLQKNESKTPSDSEGAKLHDQLVARDRANPEDSFINPFWDDMYLRGRGSIAIHSNPFLQLVPDKRPAMCEQTKRAANVLHASCQFYLALKEERLEPDVFHVGKYTDTPWFKFLVTLIPQKISYYAAYLLNGYPLDMSQYKRLFGTTRLPHAERDIVQTHVGSRHVVIMLGGRFYRLNVIDENDQAISPAALEASLKSLVALHETESAETSQGDADVGVLTTLERTQWSQVREKLSAQSSNNASTLKEIDSALFMLCLDEETPKGRRESAHLALHGTGRNRWFDKSFSALVAGNGTTSINFEHSWGDGVCVLRYTNEIHDEMENTPAWSDPTPADVKQAVVPTPLPFELDDDLRKQVRQVGKAFDSVCDKLCIEIMEFDDFGKNKIKSWKISPDGLVHMAMQLAYHRLYRKFGSTYESASTAGFLKGRTECIRPVSPEVSEFINAFANPKAANEERIAALRQAVEAHSAYSLDAKIGKGMDRHMFAMCSLAQESNHTPDVFKDKAWTNLNYNKLSTSTLVSPAIEGGGFGPVVPDGYGIGYAVVDDYLGFFVSSYKSTKETRRFVEEIREGLRDIRTVLEGRCQWVGDPENPVKSIDDDEKAHKKK